MLLIKLCSITQPEGESKSKVNLPVKTVQLMHCKT